MKQFNKSILFSFVLVFSCQRQEREVLPTAQNISIEEAKTWFEQHLAYFPAVIDNKSGRKTPKRNAIWEYAATKEFKGQEVVVVPLVNEKGHLAKGHLSKLLIMKNSQGQIEAQVVKAIGARKFLEKGNYSLHSGNFSGVVAIENWEGKFLDGELYQNGRVVGKLADASTGKGARTQGYWIELRVDNYQQVCSGSDCGPWEYLDSTIKYVYVSDGATPNSYYGTFIDNNGSGGGGAGNGSGGGNSNNCPDGGCSPSSPLDHEIIDIQVVEPPSWINYIYKYTVFYNPCDAYRDMIKAGYANNDRVLSKELGGVIAKELDKNTGNPTGADRFIAFPTSWGDGGNHITFKENYYDEQGRLILRFKDDNGKSFVTLFSYPGVGSAALDERVYEVNTLVHTHPYTSGSAHFAPNIPSPDDILIVNQLPWLTHKVVSVEKIFDFDALGSITNSQINNCK